MPSAILRQGLTYQMKKNPVMSSNWEGNTGRGRRWLGGRHEALAAASEGMSTPQANASDGFGKAEVPCQQTVLESSPLSHTSPVEIELRKPGRARSGQWKREMPNEKALSVGSSPLSPTCLVENELLDVSLGLKAKYQGCMVGALIGDCLGSPFEEIPFREVLPTSQLPYFLWRIRRKLVKADDMAGRRFTADPDHEFGGYYKFTDDTAMTHALAESLLDCGGFDPTVVARRFTEDFYQNGEVKHEYGPKVRWVFAALAKEKYEDVYGPAKEQFDGAGSYGNGAAMRVAPVSLYYYGDEKKAVQTSNGFIRALFFAISMGGDADTIATMAGSIAGAYYGIFKVPRTMQRYCQGEQRATCLGNRLLTERRQPK
ncbi:ADP-ribosylhydrolase ARH3-like isoform X6 [Dermacentor albipictus]|uniref:ADP-ribosylhydrolase ARH3-like isoform X6 n=1 Tax=Dermacentor albipictus TaxID=60249 RepID=UPI0031FE00E1